MIYIPNDDKQNKLICIYIFNNCKVFCKTLDTNSLKPTNHNSIKVPKVFELTMN